MHADTITAWQTAAALSTIEGKDDNQARKLCLAFSYKFNIVNPTFHYKTSVQHL